MNASDFDYDLPRERIAQEPLPERDASRLLLLDRRHGTMQHHVFRDLPGLLAPGDLLIVNRSRVLPARLLGRLPGGGRAEVLLVRSLGAGRWEALVRPGRRVRHGTVVELEGAVRIRVEPLGLGDAYAGAADGARAIRLENGGDIESLLERVGHTPLPPYVRRPDRPQDRERYQTVYAREGGSVAAPTAGLHFTAALLARLAERGIERAEIVLHVGPGTFKPVRARRVEEHRVEPEPFLVPPEAAAAIERARARGGRVVAVGTTTTRALESCSRDGGFVEPRGGKTDLVIVPGFRFRVVDALLTNFHLPRSSLLVLVAAFAGREQVLDAYGEALREGYRFYSYGDAMLIL